MPYLSRQNPLGFLTVSPYSPATVVWCHQLNEYTARDVFTLPRSNETVEAFAGEKYSFAIDLAAGYHQREVHPRDQQETAFVLGLDWNQKSKVSQHIFSKLKKSLIWLKHATFIRKTSA